jgi:hypothetical protein
MKNQMNKLFIILFLSISSNAFAATQVNAVCKGKFSRSHQAQPSNIDTTFVITSSQGQPGTESLFQESQQGSKEWELLFQLSDDGHATVSLLGGHISYASAKLIADQENELTFYHRDPNEKPGMPHELTITCKLRLVRK